MKSHDSREESKRVEFEPFEHRYLRNPVYVSVVNETIKTAHSAYKYARVLSVILFSVGIGLIIVSVLFSLYRNETALTYFFGGLGVTSILSLFLYRPIEKIQTGVDALIKSQIACMSFMAQYDILMRPLADTPNTSFENRWKISELMKGLTSQLIVDLAITSAETDRKNKGESK